MIATAPGMREDLNTIVNWARQQQSASLLTESHVRCADWLEANYYIPVDRGRPRRIKLLEHQKIILWLFFEEAVAQALFNAFCAQTLVYSTVKKSGKTSIAGG